MFGHKWVYSGKVIVFGQNRLYWGEVVVIGQSGCIRSKVIVNVLKLLYSGIVVVFG